MRRKMLLGYLKMKNGINDFLKEERGETNIIAIILLIIVVIALIAIFRAQLIEIINGLFQQIKDSLGL